MTPQLASPEERLPNRSANWLREPNLFQPRAAAGRRRQAWKCPSPYCGVWVQSRTASGIPVPAGTCHACGTKRPPRRRRRLPVKV